MPHETKNTAIGAPAPVREVSDADQGMHNYHDASADELSVLEGAFDGNAQRARITQEEILSSLIESLQGAANSHLMYEQVAAYLDGLGQAAHTSQIERHLARCHDCRVEVYELLLCRDNPSAYSRAAEFLLPYVHELFSGSPRIIGEYTGRVDSVDQGTAYLSLYDCRGEPCAAEYDACKLEVKGIREGDYLSWTLLDYGIGAILRVEPLLPPMQSQSDLDRLADRLAQHAQ